MNKSRHLDIGRAATPIAFGVLTTLVMMSATAARANAAIEPTAESALAADQRLATAIRNNDANDIENMLADDWMVIATTGGMAKGKGVFPSGIKSGYLTRKSYELVDPMVRLFGKLALVTSEVKTSGILGGKPFDVIERQTDVLVWKNGSWKCVLTQETKMGKPGM